MRAHGLATRATVLLLLRSQRLPPAKSVRALAQRATASSAKEEEYNGERELKHGHARRGDFILKVMGELGEFVNVAFDAPRNEGRGPWDARAGRAA